jgi:glycoside hydrolase-like protein
MRPSLPAHLDRRHGLPARCALLAALLIAALPAVALGASANRSLRYHGYRVSVPAGWRVIRLQGTPTACVRFNQHAVYLGTPSVSQICPATAAGRTEAILVSPARSAAAARALLPAGPGAANHTQELQLVNAADGVTVTATWNRHPGVIEHALGLRSLTPDAAATRARRPASEVAYAQSASRSFARARATAAQSTAGEIYTGSGFDACSTPSPSQMTAWGASPYRGIGVYIGGTNMACSQPNLSATWVSEQSVAGWHLIPIYVGLQAPSNSCGCAAISSSTTTAASEGAAAAQDAVTDAQAIGLGPGNPLYDDMESYSRTATNSGAVLAFLSGWTTQLHASGYVSGVYSSSDSGVEDLVAEYGTGYAEPDELWIANWNNQQNTVDPNVPSTEWAAHQRLHQFEGAHNETYDGVKINIDGDYIDAATAAAGTGAGIAPPAPAPAPSLGVSNGPDGTVDLTPSWLYEPGISTWQIVGGSSPTALGWVGPAAAYGAHLPIVTASAFSYYAVQALNAGGQVMATSAPVADPAHLAIFGQGAFAPHQGLGAVPVGCFNVRPCVLSTTITAGRTTLATTKPEHLSTSVGLTYFQLTARAQSLLQHAKHHQLAVKIKIRDGAGASVTRPLTLTSFSTADPNPARSISSSPQIRFIGTTEFVSNGWVGGVLVACASGAPCQTKTTLTAGGKTIAKSTAGTLGAGQLGYLYFTLTAAGHRLLQHAAGNQLATAVTVTTPSSTAASSASGGTGAASPVSGGGASKTARARVALVAFY